MPGILKVSMKTKQYGMGGGGRDTPGGGATGPQKMAAEEQQPILVLPSFVSQEEVWEFCGILKSETSRK